jgi:hypothetical protein
LTVRAGPITQTDSNVQTKALTLEEVNLAFGEKVEVRLVDITLDDSESNKMAVSVFQKEQVRDA